MKKILIIVFLTVLSLMPMLHAQAEEDKKSGIVVTDAWIRGMPPSFKHTAAYLTITNKLANDIVLIKVITDIAETIELHTMSMDDGKMIMSELDQIRIVKNGRVELKPEGKHIMLIDLTQPLNIGDKIPLQLEFQGGLKVQVVAEVKMDDQKQNKGSSHKGSHMKGSMHNGH